MGTNETPKKSSEIAQIKPTGTIRPIEWHTGCLKSNLENAIQKQQINTIDISL